MLPGPLIYFYFFFKFVNFSISVHLFPLKPPRNVRSQNNFFPHPQTKIPGTPCQANFLWITSRERVAKSLEPSFFPQLLPSHLATAMYKATAKGKDKLLLIIIEDVNYRGAVVLWKRVAEK